MITLDYVTGICFVLWNKSPKSQKDNCSITGFVLKFSVLPPSIVFFICFFKADTLVVTILLNEEKNIELISLLMN